VLRWLLKAPQVLYKAHAGRLLGHRFLLLTHRGRKSGRSLQTVLEVVSWDRGAREAVVLAGLGRRAQWYRNLKAAGVAEITIGAASWAVRVRTLGPAEGAAVLADYERRNRFARPVVRLVLSRLAGIDYDGSEAARRELIERLPLVSLTPDDVV
jgi:deazaflavin-dependent oxidoreductase (nitroreductase family)